MIWLPKKKYKFTKNSTLKNDTIRAPLINSRNYLKSEGLKYPTCSQTSAKPWKDKLNKFFRNKSGVANKNLNSSEVKAK